MIVVGVGCGPGMMTEEAVARIKAAKNVYGSRRAIEIASTYIPSDCEVHPVTDFSDLSGLPEDSVVLSTGDPMLAGLGHLGLEVVPGISSLQLAFSRLKLPLTRAVVIDAHGDKDMDVSDEVMKEMSKGRIAFILTSPDFKVDKLASDLMLFGADCEIAICEDLGYPSECISVGTPSRPPVPGSGLFSVVVVKV
ncbi:MAG: cobalt-precorrin-7 (C(5))-methyltransferase [Methanomassiliicoccales archaeon]|nr:MAG: cobalt-precorrin-7 (C(5))-methyltransferase [Methanomassiliicoccales archaeon]